MAHFLFCFGTPAGGPQMALPLRIARDRDGDRYNDDSFAAQSIPRDFSYLSIACTL
jgi:hypothetical protein